MNKRLIELFRQAVAQQIALWDTQRAMELEVGKELELAQEIETAAAACDNPAQLTDADIQQTLAPVVENGTPIE